MTHTTNFRRGLCLLLACLVLSLWVIPPLTVSAAGTEWNEASAAGAQYQWKYTFYGSSTTSTGGHTSTQYLTVVVFTDGEAYVHSTVSSALIFPIPSVIYEFWDRPSDSQSSDYECWWTVTSTSNDSVEYTTFTFTEWKKEPNGTSSDDGGNNGDGGSGNGTDMTETNNWLQKIYNAITGLASAVTTPITNSLQTVRERIESGLTSVKAAVDNVKTTLGSIGNLIQQQVVGGITSVKNAVNSVGNGVTQVVDFFTGTSYVESPSVALKFGGLFDLFPFNIPKGIYDTIAFWGASAAPPTITVPLPNYGGGGMDIYEFEINLSEIPGMDALAALIRAGELILFVVGLVILTEKVTKW